MPVESDHDTDPQDLFLWPDGFWCFREEFSEKFLRDDGYRILSRGSGEWLKLV